MADGSGSKGQSSKKPSTSSAVRGGTSKGGGSGDKPPQKPTQKPAPPPAGKQPSAHKSSPPGSAGGSSASSSSLSKAKAAATVGVVGAAGAAAVSAELLAQRESQVRLLQSRFETTQAAAQLSDVHQAMGDIESRLAEIPVELQTLRDRGYVHAGRLEEKIQALQQQWRRTRPGIDSALRTNVARLRSDVEQAAGPVRRLSAHNEASIQAAESAVSALSGQVDAVRRSVAGQYDDLQRELQSIDHDLRGVAEMLEIIAASPEINLRSAEGPLLAVKAEWRRDGKEGPDGHLILTDQRLLFEQNEELVKKKHLGLFAAEKETVQKLLFDVAAHEIESVKASEEGGFLGMGKEDILDLVLGANAPVSRARFHLKGEESADWAAWINRVKSGDVDRDRAARFQEEVAGAAAVALSFPSQCPSCFATVPVPPRGVQAVTCEFCGGLIKPEAAA